MVEPLVEVRVHPGPGVRGAGRGETREWHVRFDVR